MILPIHLLHSGDEPEFGKEYVLLSKLAKHGFPIADGVIAAPPIQEIKAFLASHEIYSLADFEMRQAGLLQKLVDERPSTHTIDKEAERFIESNWPNLAKNWLGQVHSHFIRFGDQASKHLKLHSLPIIFVTQTQSSGIVGWNQLYNRPEVKLQQGESDLETITVIEDWVMKAYKKLGIHYDYSFIVDTTVKFTRLSQANHEAPRLQSVAEVRRELPKTKLKRNIKLYSEYDGTFVLDTTADGYFLKSEEFGSHDEKLNVLLETMIAKAPQPVLYRISPKFIKSDAAVLNYCRNIKKRDNVQAVFPGDVSREELMVLKRDLAAEGVNRKGKMLFWAMVGVPASILRLEEILSIGFDGIILDIDSISASLHNRDEYEIGDQKEAQALLAFLEPVIKNLNKQKIPFVFSESSGIAEDILEKAVKWGASAVITSGQMEEADQLIAFKEHAIHFDLKS